MYRAMILTQKINISFLSTFEKFIARCANLFSSSDHPTVSQVRVTRNYSRNYITSNFPVQKEVWINSCLKVDSFKGGSRKT